MLWIHDEGNIYKAAVASTWHSAIVAPLDGKTCSNYSGPQGKNTKNVCMAYLIMIDNSGWVDLT